jgi:hypothetical protein
VLSRSDINGLFHARLASRLRLQLFGMEVLRVCLVWKFWCVLLGMQAVLGWMRLVDVVCVCVGGGGAGAERGGEQGVRGCMCAITQSH